MDTTTNTNPALATLTPGTVIEIACKGHKPRVVTVTGNDGRFVYTTSGRTLRPNLRGGMIRDYGEGFGLMYQPTLSQQVRPVESVTVVGISN
jgi:hypothetical protein